MWAERAEHLTEEDRAALVVEVRGAEALPAFSARRATQGEPREVSPMAIDPVLLDWQSSAARGELRDVVVQLRGRPPKNLASRVFDPLAVGPTVDAAAGLRARQRADWVSAATEAVNAFADDVEADGAVIVRSYPSLYRLRARVDSSTLAVLALRDDVRSIVDWAAPTPDANAGSEIQHATQVFMALDNGYDGSQPSGMVAGAGAMRAMILDTYFDEDHPVWVARRHAWYLWDSQLGDFRAPTPSDTSQTQSGGAHGSSVVTQLLADGSAPPLTPIAKIADRSGMAPGAEFVFLQCRDVHGLDDCSAFEDLSDFLNQVPEVEELPDIVQVSWSIKAYDYCSQGAANNLTWPAIDVVNNLYLDDVFVSNTPGNEAKSLVSCTVAVPGNAAGAFAAGALDPSDVPQKTAHVSGSSSVGPDVHGRSMIRLAAIGGREEEMADFDDAYTDTTGTGTSYASPVVAGAALDLKDMFVTFFGSGVANHVGNLYAGMLLAGDDTTHYPNPLLVHKNHTNPAADHHAGMGRLTLRTFGAAGMDAPHRTRLSRFTLADGDQQVVPTNPDNGINQVLPTDVERLEAVVWWYEPNLECLPPNYTGCDAPADVLVQLCEGNTCYDSDSDAPGPRRLIAPAPAGGKQWEIRVTGVDVPPSSDADYHYQLDEREMHVMLMWEDTDRDDADGPTCADEIDVTSCTACCNQAGASCPVGECDP